MDPTGGMETCMGYTFTITTSLIKVSSTSIDVILNFWQNFIHKYYITPKNASQGSLFLVEEEEKSISLSPQLTPTVNFKLIKDLFVSKK